jgi:hypothetical protein
MHTSRVRIRAMIVLFTGFWALVTVGGAMVPGYRQYEDYISSLGARGVGSPAFGIVAVLCAAAAHLIAARMLSRADVIVAAAIGVASGALVVAAVARVTCPAELCPQAPTGVTDLWDVLHEIAVGGYTVAVVVAMMRTGMVLLRDGTARSLGAASAVAALSFVAVLALTAGPAAGLSQRFWALAGQVWLVLVAAAAGSGVWKRDSAAAPEGDGRVS